MSYDIDLFTPVAGKTLAQSLDIRCAGELAELTEVERQKILDLSAMLQKDFSFEYAASEKLIALIGVGHEVSLTFYSGDYCAASIPYARDARETARNFDVVYKVMQQLQKSRGFVASDPQIGDVIEIIDEHYIQKMLEIAGYTNESIEGLIPKTATTKEWWQFW